MHHVIDVDEDYEIVGFYELMSSKPPDCLHSAFLLPDLVERCVGMSAQTGRNSLEVPYDMEYGFDSVEETDKKRQRCELVPPPEDDPLYGKGGPVTQLWKRD